MTLDQTTLNTMVSQAVAAALAAQTATQETKPLAPRGDFDFTAFNNLVNPTAAGLKLALAENLLKDALKGFQHYKNNKSDELEDLTDALIQFRVDYKASRAKADEGAIELQNKARATTPASTQTTA